MVLSEGYTLYDEYGRSVLDIRDKTEFGAFRQKDDCVIESPARFGGGVISCAFIGAFHM